jgi:hypothetical protein
MIRDLSAQELETLIKSLQHGFRASYPIHQMLAVLSRSPNLSILDPSQPRPLLEPPDPEGDEEE